jgi:diguanylate cyclase (GGDEF)-like protein
VHELERDLIHDPLTGLKTRAFFEEELGVYLKAVAENEDGKRKNWFGFKNIAILFFDIDHFKKVNDTFGHAKGDEILKEVAKTIQSNLRVGDTVARWGGEEMVALILGANVDNAKSKAETIRQAVEKLGVTVSIGIALAEKGLSLPEIIKRADEALYKAKETGRNKVVIHE